MNAIPSDYRVDWPAEMAVWSQTPADNLEQLTRLHQNLRKACRQELTARQLEVLSLRYGQQLGSAAIARRLGVNRSTVHRTLHRAEERLRHCLQYSL